MAVMKPVDKREATTDHGFDAEMGVPSDLVGGRWQAEEEVG
jgi:hypothetical protein